METSNVTLERSSNEPPAPRRAVPVLSALPVQSAASSAERTHDTPVERAAWLGALASVTALASGAALATMNDALFVPGVVIFAASVIVGGWSRGVLGRSKRRE